MRETRGAFDHTRSLPLAKAHSPRVWLIRPLIVSGKLQKNARRGGREGGRHFEAALRTEEWSLKCVPTQPQSFDWDRLKGTKSVVRSILGRVLKTAMFGVFKMPRFLRNGRSGVVEMLLIGGAGTICTQSHSMIKKEINAYRIHAVFITTENADFESLTWEL